MPHFKSYAKQHLHNTQSIGELQYMDTLNTYTNCTQVRRFWGSSYHLCLQGRKTEEHGLMLLGGSSCDISGARQRKGEPPFSSTAVGKEQAVWLCCDSKLIHWPGSRKVASELHMFWAFPWRTSTASWYTSRDSHIVLRCKGKPVTDIISPWPHSMSIALKHQFQCYSPNSVTWICISNILNWFTTLDLLMSTKYLKCKL